MRVALLVLGAMVSLPLSAALTITPDSGPSAGGTEVTIKGDLPTTIYGVVVGGAQANYTRTDPQTVVVTTPEHLPGKVAVRFLGPTGFASGSVDFTYTGEAPASYERILLPIFLAPVKGAFGSEFVTSFTAELTHGTRANLHGLSFACVFICPPDFFSDLPIGVVTESPRIDDSDQLVRNGNPGRFLYVQKQELANVALSLRVYDRSRSSQNYGTEIPVVRENRFTEGYTSLTLLNVPTDARFRNTLRIYATGPLTVKVRVDPSLTAPVDHDVTLAEGENVFRPATATFTTFPTNAGLATVTISIPEPAGDRLAAPPHVWAFVSVTNNDTQMITTVTPQL